MKYIVFSKNVHRFTAISDNKRKQNTRKFLNCLIFITKKNKIKKEASAFLTHYLQTKMKEAKLKVLKV